MKKAILLLFTIFIVPLPAAEKGVEHIHTVLETAARQLGLNYVKKSRPSGGMYREISGKDNPESDILYIRLYYRYNTDFPFSRVDMTASRAYTQGMKAKGTKKKYRSKERNGIREKIGKFDAKILYAAFAEYKNLPGGGKGYVPEIGGWIPYILAAKAGNVSIEIGLKSRIWLKVEEGAVPIDTRKIADGVLNIVTYWNVDTWPDCPPPTEIRTDGTEKQFFDKSLKTHKKGKTLSEGPGTGLTDENKNKSLQKAKVPLHEYLKMKKAKEMAAKKQNNSTDQTISPEKTQAKEKEIQKNKPESVSAEILNEEFEKLEVNPAEFYHVTQDEIDDLVDGFSEGIDGIVMFDELSEFITAKEQAESLMGEAFSEEQWEELLDDAMSLDIFETYYSAGQRAIDAIKGEGASPEDKVLIRQVPADAAEAERKAAAYRNLKLYEAAEASPEALAKKKQALKKADSILFAVDAFKNGIDTASKKAEELEKKITGDNAVLKLTSEKIKTMVKNYGEQRVLNVLKAKGFSDSEIAGFGKAAGVFGSIKKAVEDIKDIQQRQKVIDKTQKGTLKKSLTILNVASKFTGKIASLFKAAPAMKTAVEISGLDKVDAVTKELTKTIGNIHDQKGESEYMELEGGMLGNIASTIQKRYGQKITYTDSSGKEKSFTPESYRVMYTDKGKKVLIPCGDGWEENEDVMIVDTTEEGFFCDDDKAVLVDRKTGKVLRKFDLN